MTTRTAAAHRLRRRHRPNIDQWRRQHEPLPIVWVYGIVAGMVLDNTAPRFTTNDLPGVADHDRPELTRLVTILERHTPGHKWDRLNRLRRIVDHYNLDVTVKEATA